MSTGFDPALQALVLEEPLVVLLALVAAVAELRLRQHRPGRDAVDVDEVLAQLARHPLDQPVHGALGGDVGHVAVPATRQGQ